MRRVALDVICIVSVARAPDHMFVCCVNAFLIAHVALDSNKLLYSKAFSLAHGYYMVVLKNSVGLVYRLYQQIDHKIRTH